MLFCWTKDKWSNKNIYLLFVWTGTLTSSPLFSFNYDDLFSKQCLTHHVQSIDVGVKVTHSKQNQIHLKLSNPSTNAASHSKAKREVAKGIWPVMAVTEPPLRLKCEWFWECILIMTDGVVTEREMGLEKQQWKDKKDKILNLI